MAVSPDKMIQVRLARTADRGALGALRDEVTSALRRIYLPVTGGAAHRRIMPRFDVLVAWMGGELAGTLEYTLAHETLYLQGLGVANRFRGQGVARALIEHVADIGQHYPLSHMELCTIRETGNVAVFERMGFSVCDERPSTQFVGAAGQPVSEVIMQRRLP
ncbi:GNAT family N-acetyltransferase [Isoalcanivorax indicus]|uniref:GNAT family N-acetyltransferase n=1 Tax=Isoalcanivorax indicus TaxID=2202653 RepID=UPI000DB9E169|nr:GNAT family N-acetyltransferase [Isoalcanivorax indicus]